MQIGQPCRLDNSHYSMVYDSASSLPPRAIGFIIAQRPHLDNLSRILYYFRTTHIEFPDTANGSVKRRSRIGGQVNSHNAKEDSRFNRLHASSQAFVSSEGYFYRFDGWYDAVFLYPIDGKGVLENIPNDWLSSVERNTAPCEMQYLCYSFHPWFSSPFHALQYLALPESGVCYSVSICHRCLSPFFSEKHLTIHMEGYCERLDPPGTLIYHDPTSGRRVWYVDGAQHLHYARCISLLGNCFIESKLLRNDVDMYEFFIITLPRTALPYVPGSHFENETQFKRSAVSFDKAKWSGHVVAGYFSRLKHKPHHTLSCIVTLPMFQRMRLGSFMLDVAYALMVERGQQCGCSQWCGCLKQDGGCISRPFSPHGESLLLSYWRRSLERLSRNRKHEANPNVFSTLEELRSAMDIPIAAKDLLFLLTHDNIAFYSSSEKHWDTRSPCEFNEVVNKRTYNVSLVFDKHQIETIFEKPDQGYELGDFQRKWFRRNTDQSLVYNKTLFHY
ncbi:unnamed protein product [Phytomonas sp. EM1]|nr:unnamed protein product [Phytomonas sp. EM1]|eukprot:CCW61913.1 unnamed protein product [Phytomonas sp. isolate EM1]